MSGGIDRPRRRTRRDADGYCRIKVRGLPKGLDLPFARSFSEEDFAGTVKGGPYMLRAAWPSEVLGGCGGRICVRFSLHQWGTGYDRFRWMWPRKIGRDPLGAAGRNFAPTIADLPSAM